MAAYNNDSTVLEELLEIEEHRKSIDARIRPYLATPLRLAATGWSTKGTLISRKVQLHGRGSSCLAVSHFPSSYRTSDLRRKIIGIIKVTGR